MGQKMNILFIVLAFVSIPNCTVSGWSDNGQFIKDQSINAKFNELFQDHANKFDWTVKNSREFPCKAYSLEDRIINVHRLSPVDISVVAALGDSTTAGLSMKAKVPMDMLLQNPGSSFSIGGDATYKDHVTLPNIIKQYNPKVKGFSVGNGQVAGHKDQLNMAVSADESNSLHAQANELVKRMRLDEDIDVENDWKIITVSIGRKRCPECDLKDIEGIIQHVEDIQRGLDVLHKRIPKALVNVLMEPNMDNTNFIEDSYCHAMLKRKCPCKNFPDSEQMITNGVRLYNDAIFDLVESGRYDTNDDFTVVVQPFFKDAKVPRLRGNALDLSFLSKDCYHLSEKGHKAAAVALWNNMIEPSLRKTTSWMPGEDLKCPTSEHPYFYTRLNSKSTGFSKSTADDKTLLTSQSGRNSQTMLTVGIIGGIGIACSMIVLTVYLVIRRRKTYTDVSETKILLPGSLYASYTKL